MPHRIGFGWDTPADFAAVFEKAPDRLKTDLRKVRRWNLQTSETRSLDELREFYETIYLPGVREGHGPLAAPRPWQALVGCLRRGGLVWIDHDGFRAGAFLYACHGGAVLELTAFGLSPHRQDPRWCAGHAFLYVKVAEKARERGCRRIDLGGSRPSLTDGVLRFKAKWGGSVQDNVNTPHDLCLRWEQTTPAIVEMLTDHPLIIRHAGGFAALTAESASLPRELRLRGIGAFFATRPGDRFRDWRALGEGKTEAPPHSQPLPVGNPTG